MFFPNFSRLPLPLCLLSFGGGSFAPVRRPQGGGTRNPRKPNSPLHADTKKAGKPSQLASYGDWGVFLAQGDKSKTCYALASPKDRAPAGLKRDPAYVFISNRPGEKVRGEVSIIMGFSVKDGAAAHADIGGSGFDLVAKGANAWIKNQAQEPQFVDALKKGSKLIVKAPSLKGRLTIDSYSLAGLSQALDRVQKECP